MQLVSWYLPTLEFSLWPCAILLLVFIPVSIWHELNWRRTLAEYARLRVDAGARDVQWPPPGTGLIMGVQPGLVLFACGLLAVVVTVAAGAALMWPRRPPGFDLAINPYDLPFIWSMIVAATAAIVAGAAIAIDAWRSPWSRVAWLLRRAIHASPIVRHKLFVQALAVDPELRDRTAAACPPAPGVTAPAPLGAPDAIAPEAATAPEAPTAPSESDSAR